MQVFVRDNNVDQPLRALKKKMQREGVFREMKLRKHYEKPGKESLGEGGSGPSRPQTRAQKVATRGFATDEASGGPRDRRERPPRALAPFLICNSRRQHLRPGLGVRLR